MHFHFRYSSMSGRLPVYNAKGELVLLKPKFMSHFKSMRNSCCIYMDDGSQYVVSKPLAYVLAWLEDSGRFIRAHRSYAVNRWYVVGITTGNHLIMEDGTEIPISKVRYKGVIAFLNILPPPPEEEEEEPDKAA